MTIRATRRSGSHPGQGALVLIKVTCPGANREAVFNSKRGVFEGISSFELVHAHFGKFRALPANGPKLFSRKPRKTSQSRLRARVGVYNTFISTTLTTRMILRTKERTLMTRQNITFHDFFRAVERELVESGRLAELEIGAVLRRSRELYDDEDIENDSLDAWGAAMLILHEVDNHEEVAR